MYIVTLTLGLPLAYQCRGLSILLVVYLSGYFEIIV